MFFYVSAILYTFQYKDLSIQEVYKSKSRSGDVVKGHDLSDNLRTTLTHPHPNTIDRCPSKYRSKLRGIIIIAALNLNIFVVK